eukprot:7161654-Prorocentrum_lima.AAC.1
MDKAEDMLLSQTEHQACIEYGEKQVEYLKALDFMDTEKLRFYNVCRAKTQVNALGEHRNCGLAFPAKMWKKTQGWRFYCEVDWSVLEKE